MSKRLDDLDSAIDRQEQHTRRNCLLLHGTEEESKENTVQHVIDLLSESIQDID